MNLLHVGICPCLTSDYLSKLKGIHVTNVTEFIATDVEELAKKSRIPLKVMHYRSNDPIPDDNNLLTVALQDD